MTSHYEHRILHTEEKQFLSPEAQDVAYHHFLTQEVAPEIVEKAVLQAQILSNFGARAISGSLFAQIINANICEQLSASGAGFSMNEFLDQRVC